MVSNQALVITIWTVEILKWSILITTEEKEVSLTATQVKISTPSQRRFWIKSQIRTKKMEIEFVLILNIKDFLIRREEITLETRLTKFLLLWERISIAIAKDSLLIEFELGAELWVLMLLIILRPFSWLKKTQKAEIWFLGQFKDFKDSLRDTF